MKPESIGQEQETKEELIERLLAKAELDYKCCGSHCHAARREDSEETEA